MYHMITTEKFIKFVEACRRKPFSMIGVFSIYGLNLSSLLIIFWLQFITPVIWPAVVLTIIVTIMEWNLLVVPAINWLNFQAGLNQ